MKKYLIPLIVGSIAIYTLTPSLAGDNEMLSAHQLLSEAEKIVALFNSPTAIDLDTGCGHRNYSGIGAKGGIFYPDGIERSRPSGDLRHVSRGGIEYDQEHSVQYWNDWLGLSEDIEEALEEAENAFYEPRINEIVADLQLNDAELIERYSQFDPAYRDMNAEEIRSHLEETHKYWTEMRENTRQTFSGYPLLLPEDGDRVLTLSERVEDVGYWEFSATSGNAVRGGYDWEFSSDSEGLDAYFHDDLLDVPLTPAGGGWGITGSVDLTPRDTIDRNLDRQSFTLAFSVLPEGLPTEMPSQEDNMDTADWDAYYRKHSPTRLLFSFGYWYRWMQIYYNELCQVEITLNLSAPGGYRPHRLVYLVSQVELDISSWNEIQFTIDIPSKQASLTVSDGSEKGFTTEIFLLPEDFLWSFQEDWETNPAWSGVPNIHYVDNNLGIHSGSGSGSFAGKLDWVYLANGTLDSTAVAIRISALRESGAVARESASIDISPDGYVAAATLPSIDYPEWEAGAFVNSSMRNNLLRDVYAHFEDAFDFVFLLQNEEDSDLNYHGMYLGYSNDVMGISEDKEGFDHTRYAGSDGQLKGVIHFPVESGISFGPSLHELMHQWGNFSLNTGALTAYTFDGNVSNAGDPLEQVPAYRHWGISSVDGQLGGFDLSTLVEQGDNWYSADPFGTFANGGNSIPYGNFELYLMGLIPPEEVEDLILFKGLRATAGEFFDNHRWYAEEKVTVTIEDIMEKLGPRVPDHTASQKEFRILALVLTDRELTDQEWVYFSEQARDFEGTFSWATGDRAEAKVGDLDTFVAVETAVESAGDRLPRVYSLAQNFPNPFNPATTIRYELKDSGSVSLSISNMSGQRIRQLVEEHQQAGYYELEWDGRDVSGARVATGVYLYELRTGDFRSVRKMVLMK